MKKALLLSLILVFTQLSFAAEPSAANADLDKESVDKLIEETQKFEADKSKETKKAASVPEEAQPVFKSEQAKEAAAPATVKSPWLKMFMSLGLVLGMMGGLFLVYRRWPWAQKMSKRARMIEVLSMQSLGQRRSLAVVRVAGESVLIGVTDNNINLLKSLSLLEEEVPPRAKFSETLSENIEKQSDSSEEFTIKNLKDIVGKKLKNFKEI